MQHYIVNKKDGNFLYFNKEDYHHIKNVMRLKDNDQVIGIYDNSSFLCELNISEEEIKGKIIKKLETKNLVHVNLIMSLIKNDKYEMCLQKACELNVSEFTGFFATRSIIKIDEKDLKKKLERQEKIIKEATEQTERSEMMKLNNPIKIDEIKNHLSDINLLIDEKEGRENPSNTLLNYLLDKKYKSISLIIGPEGGFTDNERDKLHSLGFISVSLSNSILRAETAVISALSIINAVNMRKI